ncbi:GNAT family N-acetyltransferase [Sinomicrobium pectinilyticum]|uniref:GNAT family N-acetyltransferase n=1 Tax=Sinomicrobium pectinilyticum TaxID=1084421 RepID=A0A3N0EY53_SINP1|nr:GNAT family N-acetyltransferase [Sinomicrobium pectinilyticum]RNL92667.1 GNAT family N-acetyltransferase [Sinomicrobium pectinilyticum]
MDEIQIRQATPGDLDTLLEFEQGIIEAERPFDSTLKEEKISYYDLGAYIEDSNTEVVVAECDGQLIGSGYARIMEALPYLKHEKYAYLGFMYVRPGYRGKGVNKQIVDALKKWSLKQGVTEMRLNVYSANEAAIKAYEKAGFVKHIINMRMPLV